MDALHVWGALLPFNWVVKPAGTVFPYFCSVVKEGDGPVSVRFLMLEGRQTMHDYVRTRADPNFGFYSSPLEFPRLELVIIRSGGAKLFRYDTGFMPVEAAGAQRELAAKILWESYGLLMRVEADPKLPMKFADEKAVFARVEDPDGSWRDAPLEIPDPRPHVEKVTFDKADIKRAQDLPFASDAVLDVDFRLVRGEQTNDAPRPRTVYQLVALDPSAKKTVFDFRVSISSDGGIRGLWESMPPQVLRSMIATGRIAGEIRVKSARVFRFLRPLCVELPFKLSLHDSLPGL